MTGSQGLLYIFRTFEFSTSRKHRMLFTTPWFLVFTLTTTAIFCVCLKSASARRWLLLLASVTFYYNFAGFPSLLVVTTLAIVVYLGALVSVSHPSRPSLLIGTLILPILALVYFRYTAFISDTVISILPQAALVPLTEHLNTISPSFIPLGISFFAFEFCHYLTDVMKGARPVRDPVHFAIFTFFYPRMAAGPIIRFQSIIPQIEEMPIPRTNDIVFGIRRIIFGFIKKFLIADPVGTLVVTRYTADGVLCGSDAIYLCLLLYVRIYMDFSAYSDMAIGIARLWGFHLPENFRFPFVATSPSDFWRRWHISLSTWIRDYVYIPLGGARGSQIRRGINLILAMALCGIWHGSAWHFVLWGIFHGALLIVGHFVTYSVDASLKACSVFRPKLTNRALRVAIRLSRSSKLASYVAQHLASRSAALTRQPTTTFEWLKLIQSALGWFITQTCVAFSWLLFFYPMSDVMKILRVFLVQPIIPAIF